LPLIFDTCPYLLIFSGLSLCYSSRLLDYVFCGDFNLFSLMPFILFCSSASSFCLCEISFLAGFYSHRMKKETTLNHHKQHNESAKK
jgi:hypothetical protein